MVKKNLYDGQDTDISQWLEVDEDPGYKIMRMKVEM